MINEFIKSERRQLPVILLLDVSGSMYGNKINSLNSAVKEMIKSFSDEESTKAEINVAIVTFGADTKLHTDIQPAKNINWIDMEADGLTPLGKALEEAKKLIEDKSKIPSRSYRPTVVLVSDGQPNDDWEDELESFVNEGRTAKCDRWALGIGQDADMEILRRFLNDREKKVLKAEDASQIRKFFRFITMSTTARSKSGKPNEVPIELKTFDPFSSLNEEF